MDNLDFLMQSSEPWVVYRTMLDLLEMDEDDESGEVQWAWALCDAPLLLYSVKKMRKADAPEIMKAVAHLLALRRENGWPCAVSKELGKFRGP